MLLSVTASLGLSGISHAPAFSFSVFHLLSSLSSLYAGDEIAKQTQGEAAASRCLHHHTYLLLHHHTHPPTFHSLEFRRVTPPFFTPFLCVCFELCP